MSYKYFIYSKRDEQHFLELLLEERPSRLLTYTFLALGVAGTLCNLLVLSVFHAFYCPGRIAPRLWINISACLLCTSIFMIIRSFGDYVLWLSDTETMCKLRLFVPTALDITCFACLVVMFFDRVTVLHFLSLYIFNEKNNTFKIMYGWLFGLTFFFYKAFVNKHDIIPYRCSSPFSVAFPLETVSLLVVACTSFLLLVTILGYVYVPTATSPLHKAWLDLETAETFRVILLGLIITILWLPKHLLGLIYLTNGIDQYQYQIWMLVLHLPARLTPIVPMVLLMRIQNFRQAAIVLWGSKRDQEEMKNLILSEETKADLLLRSGALALFPLHPELNRQNARDSSASPVVFSEKRATNQTLKKSGTASNVTFHAGHRASFSPATLGLTPRERASAQSPYSSRV